MQLPGQKPSTWASPQLLLMPVDTVRRPAGGEWDFLPHMERVCTAPLPAQTRARPESPSWPQIVAFMGPLPQGPLLTCTHRHHILTLTQPHDPGCRGRDSCRGIRHEGNRRHAEQTVAHRETNLSGHGGRVQAKQGIPPGKALQGWPWLALTSDCGGRTQDG